MKTNHLLFVLCLNLGFTESSFAVDSGMKTLPGHLVSATAKLVSNGTLSSTNRLNLAIGVLLRDPKGLNAFLTSIYDPASPNYRHYLTPQQFTERFGPTAADYAAVTAFAQANHLTVTAPHANRLVLDVNGSAADIQRALHLTLRTYHHPTEARDFYAPDANPSVDAALPIADISGLNNYSRPHPNNLRTRPATARPGLGSASGGNYFGNDFRAAYLPDVSLTGTGQTVGLLEFDGFYSNDIAAYESAAGIAPVPLRTILLDGYDGTPTTGPNSGDDEVSLDIEMAVAFAPGLSQVVIFEAGPDGYQNDVLTAMSDNSQISQLSSSWSWSGGPTTTTDALFQKLAAQGQSYFDAVGDEDAFTVGSSSANGVDNPSLTYAPSSSPYITIVGGTTLSTTGPDGAWTSETVWNWGLSQGSYAGTSGGISSYYAIPSWQAGVSMASNGGSTTFRNVPDVALTADNVWIYSGDGGSSSVGGTSCAAPLWAALTALVNEQAVGGGSPPVGFLNPAIYGIGEGTNYAACFHDITSGNNEWPESPGSYVAVPGYDLCTGWGTPAGQSLINALAGQPNPLQVTPYLGFTATGPVGGPFAPSSQTFLLTNQSTNALTWSVSGAASWMILTPTNGELDPGAMTNVTASLNSLASNLLAGVFTSTVTFTDSASPTAQTITFTLQSVEQSLVQNGGFETGSFTDWALTGHTVHKETTYNAVESITENPSVVHSGNYGAFLGDDELATLSQTLATVPGQSYLLSLWLNNLVAGSGQEFLVNWNTNAPAPNTLYSLINPPVFEWTNLQFIVTATGSSTVLQFAAENLPNGFGLDDVSVTLLSRPHFAVIVQNNGALNLMWQTQPGLIYQVQYETDLLSSNWMNLGAAQEATASMLTLVDTNNTNSQRFYRLIAFP